MLKLVDNDVMSHDKNYAQETIIFSIENGCPNVTDKKKHDKSKIKNNE